MLEQYVSNLSNDSKINFTSYILLVEYQKKSTNTTESPKYWVVRKVRAD